MGVYLQTNPIVMSLKLGYWKIRGLCAPCEMLCEYTEQDYKTTKYEVFKQDNGSWDRSSWFNVKYDLGIPIPNLPYLIDESSDVAISECWALAENLEGYLSDFRMGFIRVCYMAADKLEWMNKKAPLMLDTFDALLQNSDWLLGAEPTYIDFYAWEIIDHHVCMKPSFLEEHQRLSAWHARFAKLDAVEKYHASDAFSKYPINNKMAVWGGQTGPEK